MVRRTWCRAFLSAQRDPPPFPSHLWTPVQTFTSYKGLNFHSAICGFHGSRRSPTWYRGSLCVPGRPAEEAGPFCHLIPTHSISCPYRNNFFPFQIGTQSHPCLSLLPFLWSCGAGQPICSSLPQETILWEREAHGKWGLGLP